MKLLPLPAFNDNYFWLVIRNDRALVVDPGQAEPVLEALDRYKLSLESILITHHHSDHIGGLESLRKKTNAVVYAPNHPSITPPYTLQKDGDMLQSLGLSVKVIGVPGHTMTHIAYFLPHSDLGPVLFCGDTLFSGGCGRMFEGTPEVFLKSLTRLASLPKDTLVCPAHEYTLSNLKFALAVEPENPELVDYINRCNQLRSLGQPTVPSNMGQELSINPFLRVQMPQVISSAQSFNPHAKTPSQVFGALREWKNDFRS